jgi:hypothetical protein
MFPVTAVEPDGPGPGGLEAEEAPPPDGPGEPVEAEGEAAGPEPVTLGWSVVGAAAGVVTAQPLSPQTSAATLIHR